MIGACLTAILIFAAVSLAFTFWLSRAIDRRYPPVGRKVALGPGHLHVVETAPTGPERGAVALIHGASGNFADPHVALADRLTDIGFRVFAIDRPGHGHSDRLGGREAASPRQQADWICEALKRSGVREAIVVVHSLAGVLGLAMALDAPRFVRGLVLLAPVSHPWKGGVSWYYTVAASRIVGPVFRWLVVPLAGFATMRRALLGVFAPNPVPPGYADRTGLPLLFRPWHFLANAQDFVILHAATLSLSPRYREISRPTAIVVGAEDALVSAEIHARRCAHEIPGATLQLVEGLGHSPHFSAPETVIEAILSVERRANAERTDPPSVRETA